MSSKPALTCLLYPKCVFKGQPQIKSRQVSISYYYSIIIVVCWHVLNFRSHLPFFSRIVSRIFLHRKIIFSKNLVISTPTSFLDTPDDILFIHRIFYPTPRACFHWSVYLFGVKALNISAWRRGNLTPVYLQFIYFLCWPLFDAFSFWFYFVPHCPCLTCPLSSLGWQRSGPGLRQHWPKRPQRCCYFSLCLFLVGWLRSGSRSGGVRSRRLHVLFWCAPHLFATELNRIIGEVCAYAWQVLFWVSSVGNNFFGSLSKSEIISLEEYFFCWIPGDPPPGS